MSRGKIAQNIVLAREARNLKQDEIAELIGVKRSTYAEWENQTIPKGDILYKIAKALGVTMEFLLGEASPVAADAKNTIAYASQQNLEAAFAILLAFEERLIAHEIKLNKVSYTEVVAALGKLKAEKLIEVQKKGIQIN